METVATESSGSTSLGGAPDPADPQRGARDPARHRSVSSRRRRWGWALTIVGLALVLCGVLYLSGSAIGGRVHEFKDRRTYTQVKLATHRALPIALLLAAAGGGLVLLGGRLRAADRRPGASA